MTNKLFVYLDFFCALKYCTIFNVDKALHWTGILKWQNADAACIYSGCFLQLSEIYRSCTCSSGQPITLSVTFISLFVCQPHTHTYTHFLCPSFFSSGAQRSEQAETQVVKRWGGQEGLWGAEERGKEKKRRGGRIESAGMAVWTCACVPSLSSSLPFHMLFLSSPLVLFLPFPQR